MTPRGEGSIDTAALMMLTSRLGDGSPRYTPCATGEQCELPAREPGEALRRPPRVSVGPRAVIMDCGTSRRHGYTHVLWIAPDAEYIVGSHVMDLLGLIVGRVVGVEAYSWEGNDRLHVRAPGLEWEALLREAHDALANHLARP